MPLFGGIDLGGTKIQAVVLDDDHVVRGSTRAPTPAADGPAAVAAAMATALKEAAAAAAVDAADLAGVGVGAPGVVDTAHGTVAHSGNIAGWDEPFPLGGTLAEALGTRVVVGNDVGV